MRLRTLREFEWWAWGFCIAEKPTRPSGRPQLCRPSVISLFCCKMLQEDGLTNPHSLRISNLWEGAPNDYTSSGWQVVWWETLEWRPYSKHESMMVDP